MKANNEKTEVALRQASSEVRLFVVDVEAEVKKIEDKFLSIVPDASNKEGYTFCKSVRADVLPIKTGIENARKSLKAPVIEMGKLIDSSLKPHMERLDAVYKPFEDAYRAKDNEKKLREEARQLHIQTSFDRMNNVAIEAMGQTSTVIEVMIDELADFDFDPKVFMERSNEAVKRHSEIMGKLTDMLTAQIGVEQREAQAEADQKRMAEFESREAAIAEKEAAEAARVQAEKDAIERAKQDEAIRAQAVIDSESRHEAEMQAAKQRAEAQAIESEQRAKAQAEAAAQAERSRIEDERKAQEDETKKREANKKHKGKIHSEILTILMVSGLTEEHAKITIKLAATGAAGNMRIKY